MEFDQIPTTPISAEAWQRNGVWYVSFRGASDVLRNLVNATSIRRSSHGGNLDNPFEYMSIAFFRDVDPYSEHIAKLNARIEELRIECAATNDTAKQWQDMYDQAMECIAARNEAYEQLQSTQKHDNCYYRCAGCGKFVHFSEACSHSVYYERPTRAATCRCGHVGAECFNDSYCDEPAKEVAWGNAIDHDCVLMNCKDVHRTELNKAVEDAAYWQEKHERLESKHNESREILLAEIEAMRAAHKRSSLEQNEIAEAWRIAYTKRGEWATATEIKLQNRITELEAQSATPSAYHAVLGELDRLGQIINDLQADYAQDMEAWRNVYQTNESVNDDVIQEQADRIIELESTVKVLAGMVNE
jgi:hypothetical protein